MTIADNPEWISRLAAKLYEREAQFRRASQLAKRDESQVETGRVEMVAAATWSLLELTNALAELPEFAAAVGLLPLQQLVESLGDLVRGEHPNLLKPRKGMSRGKDSVQKAYIKRHAVAGVSALTASGLDVASACGIVAAEFTRAGVPARKGGSLSSKTIQEWIVEAESRPDLRKQLDAAAEEWKSKPPTQAEARAWVRRAAASDQLQVRIQQKS